MANKNIKRRNAALRAKGEHFHGSCCRTHFGAPRNKRTSRRDASGFMRKISENRERNK